jgi:hypothetical protein
LCRTEEKCQITFENVYGYIIILAKSGGVLPIAILVKSGKGADTHVPREREYQIGHIGSGTRKR